MFSLVRDLGKGGFRVRSRDPRERSPRRSSLRIGAALCVLALAVAAGCGGSSTSSGPVTLNWYIFPEFSGAFVQGAAQCSKASHGKYRIAIQTLPNSANGQHQQLALRLAAADSSMDILGLDVTWTPEFAEAGWIAPWPSSLAQQIKQGTLGSMIDTATWNGKLYSAPFNTNTQLLWYRKDLVPHPPTTWAQMISMAKSLAKQGKPHLIEIQGAQYEGYTVWFNTLVNSAGGQIVSDDGSKVELGQSAVQALKVIHELAHSPGADPSLSNQMEDQNRLQFETGQAAFEINYPFVYPSAKADVPKIFKNMAWAPYPRVKANEPAHVTIGGIDLAVSKFSNHKQLAFDAISCLREAKHEVTNAVLGGLPPVLTSVYQQPSFQKAYPFWKDILDTLKLASIRPKTPAYQSVSLEIAFVLSPPTAVNPAKDLSTLRTGIQDAINSKGLVP
jgi:multiple sugar transport system substrate-binding protein